MRCNHNFDDNHSRNHEHGRHHEHCDSFGPEMRFERRDDRRDERRFERRFERRDDRHDDRHVSDFRRFRSDRPFFIGFPRLFR